MAIRDWSTTAASNNAAPPNGWPEGQAPSSVNNVGRQMMADIRSGFEALPWFDYGHTPTRIDNDTFTVATDLTSIYVSGRRVKLVGATTGYATIASSSYSAPDTTINVTMDSGNIPTSLLTVSVGPDANNAISSLPSTVVKYDRTAAEIAAGVMPVNYAYSGLHAFRYMTSAQIASVIAADLSEDITTPLQNMLLVVAQSSNTAPAFLPIGTYKTTASLTVPANKTIVGVNYLTKLRPSAAVTKALIQQTGSTVDGIVIDGTSTTNAIGLSIGNEGAFVNNGFSRNIECINFTGSSGAGVSYNQAIGWRFDNIYCDGNQDGFVIGGTQINTNTEIFRLVSKNNARYGLLVRASYSTNIYGGVLELNGSEGLYVDQGASVVQQLTVQGMWFEQNWQTLASGAARHAAYDITVVAANSPAFRDLHFETNANSPRSINLQAAVDYLIDNVFTAALSGMFLTAAPAVGRVTNWKTSNGTFQTTFTDGAGTVRFDRDFGTFAPVLTFVTPGDLAVTYSTQVGRWSQSGNRVTVQVNIGTSAFTWTTSGGALRITGLPFTAKNVGGADNMGAMLFSGITKAGFTQFTPRIAANSAVVDFLASGTGVAVAAVNAADLPSGGTVALQFTISYEV